MTMELQNIDLLPWEVNGRIKQVCLIKLEFMNVEFIFRNSIL